MSIARIDLLKEILERGKTLDASKVDMGKWTTDPACGTTGCLIGNCMDILDFERNSCGGVSPREMPWYANTEAVAWKLRLSHDEACSLFSRPASCKDSLEKCLHRLEEFIKKEEAHGL